ncbi:MAG: GerMN domain-containing protein [Nocardioidaceae bacterium]|nr:GerMN domain-containing protein [Nocardioidaceae bacterium]MCL2611886.1 GerMN domain-containing protein [Nocardioidaceae bacterium]
MPDDHDHPYDGLRDALARAADAVTPGDGLAEVRRRTRSSSAPRRRQAGVLLATGMAAAVIVGGGVALGQWHRSVPEAASPGAATAVYFLSSTPTGTRLFREFQQADAPSDPSGRVLGALRLLTSDHGPQDPDYRTAWPAGSFLDATAANGVVTVSLSDDALRRPPGVASGDAYLGLQQAVYTAEAALGSSVPVAFVHDGTPATQVLGVPTGPRVPRDRGYDVTAPVNISDPVENQAVSGSLQARGSTGADIGTPVSWTLSLPDGREVARGTARPLPSDPSVGTSLGAPGWETGTIDVSGLAPGRYVFRVEVTATGQTSAASATYTDDRDIEIK